MESIDFSFKVFRTVKLDDVWKVCNSFPHLKFHSGHGPVQEPSAVAQYLFQRKVLPRHGGDGKELRGEFGSPELYHFAPLLRFTKCGFTSESEYRLTILPFSFMLLQCETSQ